MKSARSLLEIGLLVALSCSSTACSNGPRGSGGCARERVRNVDCPYRGYGQNCYVQCTDPPACTFDLRVTWTDGYCCGGSSDAEYDRNWVDCVCVDGFARCEDTFPGPECSGGPSCNGLPVTYCEFCIQRDGGRIDAGASTPLDAGPPDAGPATAPDTGTDGDVDAATDGGRSTLPYCSTPRVEEECTYSGYGSRCFVACSTPPTCRFDLRAEWTGGGYCCGGPPLGDLDQEWVDCVCVDGFARCVRRSPGSPTVAQTPSALCEFCPVPRDGGP